MSKTPCASAIGSLMYTMLGTCPDICHVVGIVSRFHANPGVACTLEICQENIQILP